MKIKITLVTLFLLGSLQQLIAQNNVSPYSILGLGDIEKSYFDRTTSMGHTGLALSSNRFLYHANPASYAALDDKYFNFEIAARYKGISYAGTPITAASKSQTSDFQFKKVTVALKLKKYWGVSAGLLPFSTQNYSFLGNKNVEGLPEPVLAYYEGSGSINQFYFANSFKILENKAKTTKLTVGIQAAYLFGQLQQEETLLTNVTDSTLITKRNIETGGFNFKGGLQFNTNLNKKVKLLAGATGSLQTDLKADYKLNVTDGGNTIIENNSYRNTYFKVPVMYGAGVAATIKDKYTFAVDYNFQNWNASNTKGFNYQLVNSQKVSGGFEYSNKLLLRDQQGNTIALERYFFQAGVFYSDSYLKIKGEQLKDYGVTIGGGFNALKFTRGSLGMQLGLEVGKRGTTNNGLIRENYTQFNITLSYRDIWYTNVKRYD